MSWLAVMPIAYGHTKKSLYDKMVKTPAARTLLTKCGENLPLSETVMDDLKSYVIRYIYGDLKNASLDQARAGCTDASPSWWRQCHAAHQMRQLSGLNSTPFWYQNASLSHRSGMANDEWSLSLSTAHTTTPAHWPSCTANTTGWFWIRWGAWWIWSTWLRFWHLRCR